MGTVRSINGLVLTGVWINEGHSVTFTVNEEDKDEMKVTELMRGNSWQQIGRNWSTTRNISISEAIEEQDRLIKHGYMRMN